MGAKCLRYACGYSTIYGHEVLTTEEPSSEEPSSEEPSSEALPLQSVHLVTTPSVTEIKSAAPENDYTEWAKGQPTTTSQIFTGSVLEALCLSHGRPAAGEVERLSQKLNNPLNFLVTTVVAATAFAASQRALCECILVAEKLSVSRQTFGLWHDPATVTEKLNVETCQQAKYAAETILRYYPDLQFLQPDAQTDLEGMARIDKWTRVIAFIGRF
jgi:hypothetical protein